MTRFSGLSSLHLLMADCTRAAEPYIAPDPDLAPIMEESIQREMDRRAAECDCGSSIFTGRGTPSCPHFDEPLVDRCVTCGDPLDMADADNFTRPAGANKPGRTDCGKCVRGLRRNSG